MTSRRQARRRCTTGSPSTSPPRRRSPSRRAASRSGEAEAVARHASGSCSGAASSATGWRWCRSSCSCLLDRGLLRRRRGWRRTPRTSRTCCSGPTGPERRALVRHRRARAATSSPRSSTPGQISLKIGLAVALISTVVGTAARRDRRLLRAWARPAADAPHRPVPRRPADRHPGHRPQEVRQQRASPIILVLAGLFWMYIARVVRGQVLSLKEKEFVEAARASGASHAADHRPPHPAQHASARSW